MNYQEFKESVKLDHFTQTFCLANSGYFLFDGVLKNYSYYSFLKPLKSKVLIPIYEEIMSYAEVELEDILYLYFIVIGIAIIADESSYGFLDKIRKTNLMWFEDIFQKFISLNNVSSSSGTITIPNIEMLDEKKTSPLVKEINIFIGG